MEQIIKFVNGEPRASSYLIALGFERDHKVIVELIKKYEREFENFGKLFRQKRNLFPRLKRGNKIDKKENLTSDLKSGNNLFSDLKSENKIETRGRKIEEYLLTEEQTTFLGTLLRNTPVVVAFKMKLVQEFFRMKQILQNAKLQKNNPEWVTYRNSSKEIRLHETEEIREFVAYARKQGSSNADWYYVAFSKLIKDELFVVNGKFENMRDLLSIEQLVILQGGESIILKIIKEGINESIPYKEIYKMAKKKVVALAEVHGKTEVLTNDLYLPGLEPVQKTISQKSYAALEWEKVAVNN